MEIESAMQESLDVELVRNRCELDLAVGILKSGRAEPPSAAPIQYSVPGNLHGAIKT